MGIFVLLFGAHRIPKLCRGIGEGFRELRGAARELEGVPDALEDKRKK